MIVRFRGALRLAAAVGTLIPLSGCAPSPAVRASDATAVTGVPSVSAPRAAWLAPGRVLLAYPQSGGDVFLEATWPVATGSVGASRHAVAQLDLATTVPNIETDPALRPVRLHGRADWDALLREVFADLAPADPRQATLVAVQGVDIVFHRDDGGALCTWRHERKPAELAVVRTLGEQDFAPAVTAHLTARWGASLPLLFATGHPDSGAGYVLFDPAAGQSVLIAPAAAPDPAASLGAMGISLDFTQALLLQSHMLAPLTRPFASTERFLTQAAQSAIAVVPRPVGSGEPVPPLASTSPMDLAAWERDVDRLVDSPRYGGRIRLLIDGDAFFPRFVQAVQDARESVDIRMYIFDRDAYAVRIADLLKARSREIRVRVLLDELGSIGAGADASRTPYPYSVDATARPVSAAGYLPVGANVEVRTLYTRPADPQILRAQLAAIRAARREILIEQAYVSDDAIVAALVAARRRGVDVRVILPTRGAATRPVRARLRARNGRHRRSGGRLDDVRRGLRRRSALTFALYHPRRCRRVRPRGGRMATLLWILAVAMIVVGVVGTVLPALPGAVFVLGGIALAAWIDGFAEISGWTVGVVAVLTVLAFAADYVAAMLGAKKAGASPLAIAGAAIGTVAGVFTGLVGLLFMPLVGAAIGEYIADRDLMRAGKVGIATWIGLLLGTAVKVALVFTMVGIFVAALLL